jgi:phosphoribosyl-ATP pyrophosphohydrolase
MSAPTPESPEAVLEALYRTILSRRGGDAATSYVASLFAKGPDAALKKVGEEATEFVLAAKNGEPSALVHELADLWFHSLVVLAEHDQPLSALLAELARRQGRSGLVEKASRKSKS